MSHSSSLLTSILITTAAGWVGRMHVCCSLVNCVEGRFCNAVHPRRRDYAGPNVVSIKLSGKLGRSRKIVIDVPLV